MYVYIYIYLFNLFQWEIYTSTTHPDFFQPAYISLVEYRTPPKTNKCPVKNSGTWKTNSFSFSFEMFSLFSFRENEFIRFWGWGTVETLNFWSSWEERKFCLNFPALNLIPLISLCPPNRFACFNDQPILIDGWYWWRLLAVSGAKESSQNDPQSFRVVKCE